MAKLLTSREDSNNLHAFVGFLSLLHYAYRFYTHLLLGDPHAGFGMNLEHDLLGLCLMIMPNATSFIFQKHVPQINVGDNITIWKEYRLHNLIFVIQSALFLGLKCYELHFQEIYHLYTIKCTIIAFRFSSMWLASQCFPAGRITTIRGAYRDYPAWVSIYLSYAQFVGTSIFLCWEIDIILHVITIWILQVTSFAMTLRKKAFIGNTCFLSLYFFLIMTLFRLAFLPTFLERPPKTAFDIRFKPFVMGVVTFSIRRQGVNRFVTWIIGPLLTDFVSQQLGIFVE